MKISGNLSGLYGSNSHQQNSVKALREKAMQKFIPQAVGAKSKSGNIPVLELKTALSVKEIDSLTALFGYQDKAVGHLYGKNNLKNVHAGMLFDMKG